MSGEVRQIVVSVPTECCADHQNGHPMPRYEIISVRERHGRFRKALPLVPVPLAVCLCIINVLLPGVGTFLAGFAVLCGCRTEYETKSKAFGFCILTSFLQLVSAPFVVGWVWSIMWGITLVNISVSKDVHGTIPGGNI